MRSLKRTIVVVVLVVLAVFTMAAAPTFAASPWWHLDSGSRPTNIHTGGAGVSEVQTVTVKGTAGETFVLADMTAGQELVGEFFNSKGEPRFAEFHVGDTVAAIQSGLNVVYGPGNVLVSGVTGGPYTISFVGGLGSQHVIPLRSQASALFGFAGTVSVVETTVGRRPANEIIVTASDLGDAPANGTTTMLDRLPSGLKAETIDAVVGEGEEHKLGPATCSLESLSCTFVGSIPAYDQIEIRIGVVMEGAISGENEASVTGGGAAVASIRRPLTISDAPTPFGVEGNEVSLEEEGGGVATQAGSHPFQLTSTVMLNQLAGAQPAGLPKDVGVNLPPGLIGNPTPFAQCTAAQFLTRIRKEVDNECPPKTAIGVARVTVNDPTINHLGTFTVPLFNLEPTVGEPARFGFYVLFTPVVIDTAIRTGGDYGVTATAHNIAEAAGFLKSELTFWGVPGDPRHDPQRGWGCLELETAQVRGTPFLPCESLHETKPAPFLVLPTSCTGPLQTSAQADSWDAPGSLVSFGESEQMPAMDGCNQLSFEPSISVAPDGQKGSTPTGLTVNVHVPQDESVNPTGRAQANVKDTTVALPEGVILNASAGDGLVSCSLTQIGLNTPDAASCPEASKVGTVEIKTPLLPRAITGAVYVAAQNANPFGSLVALYIVAEDPISGSRIKVAGDVHLSSSGQIVSTFSNTPQLAFEDLKLHFFGGSRAPLATPTLCGPYTTSASIDPWSGNPAAQTSSTFNITSGPNGSPCANPPGFAPSLTAGSTNLQAGAFTPLNTTLSREDGQQNIRAIKLHMPPGLSGFLSSVKLCGEAQANEGTCGPESLIGETTVSVGLGETPFSVTGGKVYITGPYEGAPFGLSIVNPAKAGPYDLGEGACDCVLVRARIEVDPHTAALTIATDETGPHKIPTVLQGIPLEIKHVNVIVNRPGFTFNPTNCNPMQITGSLTSTEGALAPLSVPFQVTNCATLGFAPKFAVTTSGKTSKANGASLNVKLTYPKTPQGTQANIARVKVDLPKALPSRLTTLQKACTNAQFEANPAGCPAASIIGYAKAITPLIPVPLQGPAYFVSHGGEAFPSLIVVLQGYGVTLDLVGTTFISKAGITSSTFKTVPDAPVGLFELNLPQGKYSALAANGNLCKSKLAMPTEFLAQNGAKINETTAITVTGCAKKKALTRAQKLAQALKACKKKAHQKRAACKATARKRYGSQAKRKTKGKKGA
jgi:hypothetical protein